MKCRFCGSDLSEEFVDLVNSPLSNSFLRKEQLDLPEIFYPLKLYVCANCFLVQIKEYKDHREIFDSDYVYFSSYSSTWLKHAEEYVRMIIPRLGLSESSQIIEIASNDGYLLQYFQSLGIPCLGVEPAAATAQKAIKKGINVVIDFFCNRTVDTLPKADLIIGNNVLAHVPDINDFVASLKAVLKDSGTVTMEFPHVLNLIDMNQFDTIYHEHFSYLSLYAVIKIFNSHGLDIYDVEELSTHGGSLRIYAKNTGSDEHVNSDTVCQVLKKEEKMGLHCIDGYKGFQSKTDRVKNELLLFLSEAKKAGKTVVGYGAAAKGNTLINYCGIKKDMIEFVADASPHKQGLFMPGSHIPVVSPEEILTKRPDYVLILPWNIKEEIESQLFFIRDWGGRFVVAIPSLLIF